MINGVSVAGCKNNTVRLSASSAETVPKVFLLYQAPEGSIFDRSCAQLMHTDVEKLALIKLGDESGSDVWTASIAEGISLPLFRRIKGRGKL
jgi:hypothetical protein